MNSRYVEKGGDPAIGNEPRRSRARRCCEVWNGCAAETSAKSRAGQNEKEKERNDAGQEDDGFGANR